MHLPNRLSDMADHRTGTCLLTENRSVETKTEADTYNLDKDIMTRTVV